MHRLLEQCPHSQRAYNLVKIWTTNYAIRQDETHQAIIEVQAICCGKSKERGNSNLNESRKTQRRILDNQNTLFYQEFS